MNAITTVVQQPQTHELALTREQVELVKRTVAQGVTDAELDLFLHTAKRLGLDPLAKQIHAVKRWDKRAGREVMAIQIAIDGFRLQAQRTREADGQDGPYWCGEDGVWKEVWLSRDPPSAAKVTVYRKGQAHPYVGIATYESYCQRKDGRPTGLWGSMPDNQLAKCAEALATRKAFPAELSGVHAPEELDQMANEVVSATARPVQHREMLAEARALQAEYDAIKPLSDHENYTIKRDGKTVRLGDLRPEQLRWAADNGKSELRMHAQAVIRIREAKIAQLDEERKAELAEDKNPDWGMGDAPAEPGSGDEP